MNSVILMRETDCNIDKTDYIITPKKKDDLRKWYRKEESCIMSDKNPTVKDRIEEAFPELLNEKSYTDITVTDIIEKAEVARVSYYRNYDSIIDIVEDIAEKKAQSFVRDLASLFETENEREMRRFLFNYFYHFQDEYTRICPENKLNREMILNRMHQKISKSEQENGKKDIKDRYMVTAKLGVIKSVAQKWGNEGFVESPEEMIDFCMSILVKI